MVDALSRLSMGIVSHIEKGKKELVQDVHRLVRYSTKGGVAVQNGSE